MSSLALSAGDWIEVKSKEEILKTLDKDGRLEGLPFMPQMFKYCGMRFRVYKRAHKTCDTVFPVRGRRLSDSVHLETRCDGEAYGGCQAGCLLFWKEAWLRKVGSNAGASLDIVPSDQRAKAGPTECTEEDVWRGTKAEGKDSADGLTYACQATLLPYYTTDLRPWDIRQYVEDYTSGNAGLGRILRAFFYANYKRLVNSGLGLGAILRWIYDAFQSLIGGVPYPRKHGAIPVGEKTPSLRLNLQPGEFVRVKSYKEILATLDENNFNRGLFFDAEMVPYCGRVFRVLKCVDHILNEKTGKMMHFKNPCIVLENVFCRSCYSEERYFCPRSIYSYWREIWLERVNDIQANPERAECSPASCAVSGRS